MPKWNTNSDSCSNICCGPTGNTGPTGFTGPTGPIGPSLSYVAGNTGPYTSCTGAIGTSATRLYEVPFTVNSVNDIYLIHYNLRLAAGGNNHTLTSTLGISTTLNQTAVLSINLVTGTTPVTLNGASSNNYMAGSHAGVTNNEVVNLLGFGTCTGLTVTTHYITLWAGGDGAATFTSPSVNMVILKIN